MLYKTEWRELGNKLYNTGTIQKVRYPLHLWLIDKWLDKHPHWVWLDYLTSDCGDPLCAAYCFVWSPYFYKHEVTLYSVQVGYDKLSEEFRTSQEKAFGNDE